MNQFSDLTPQDDEGRNYLERLYQDALDVFGQCPTLYKHAATESWINRVHESNLASTECLGQMTCPLLYMVPQQVGRDFRADYLKRVERGFEFVVRKARRKNRNDLIGNLTKANAWSALFELLLVAALVDQFGDEAVCPYPKIGEGDTTMDIAIQRDGEPRLLVEAVTFYDDAAIRMDREYRRQRGITHSGGVRNSGRDIERLAGIVRTKATQRDPDSPFVLCIGQNTIFPLPDDAVRGISELLATTVGSPDSMLVGCFYFCYDNPVVSYLFDAQAKRQAIPSKLLGECRDAFNSC